jgi:predicted RNA-binding Zn ribbon-like protein
MTGGLTAKIYFGGYNHTVSETKQQGPASMLQAAGAAGAGPRDPLCIRFINTLDWRNDAERRVEQLTAYSELVKWSRNQHLLSAEQAKALLALAGKQQRQAEQALGRALSFREALYRLFSAVAARRAPSREDLQVLSEMHAEAAPHLRLRLENETRYGWEWASGDENLNRMLWPVARSAAELLTAGPIERLRECERGGCGWLFVDTTRNRSRRWCAMKICGNRSKVERYYRRHRKEK